MVIVLIACGLFFLRSIHRAPCAGARAIFESHDEVSGYGTFQGMLAGNFRYLGGQDFIYIVNGASAPLNTKEPTARFVYVRRGVFGTVSEILTMSVPASEFYSSKGRPLTCNGDFGSPFVRITPTSPQSTS
jgi:hypothetical protein